MKIIVQRVKKASCIINDSVYSSINAGYVLLVGFEKDDTEKELDKCLNKLLKLRILEDDQGKMNLSILDQACDILSISQFTLASNLKKGNRPSFDTCLKPELAQKYYDQFNQKLKAHNLVVKTGCFGSDMCIKLENDGPCTFIIDSKELV